MKITDSEYKSWLIALKQKVRSVQIKAVFTVNAQLIEFYWELGRMISEKENVWGSKFLVRLSLDLKQEFPNLTGFSVTNLKYCKRFYLFYHHSIGQQYVDQSENYPFTLISQQAVDQIPWGHNILIFTKSNSIEEAVFYVQKTILNNWSRDELGFQIKSVLFKRNGNSVSNFQNTLPEPYSDLAQQTLKDPYIFDFLQLQSGYKEKDIENQLVNHIRKFLLELGKGFAFVGQQYHIEIAEKDYYIDLLFYHIKLKCYVVIELKNSGFIPENAGKLNFYLSAVDSILKEKDDKPTIGILLCREKNNIEAEFALRDINKPMGVSEFQLTEIIPEELKSSLPSIEDIEREFNQPD